MMIIHRVLVCLNGAFQKDAHVQPVYFHSFTKAKHFVDNEYTQIKVDQSQFRIMYEFYLYD